MKRHSERECIWTLFIKKDALYYSRCIDGVHEVITNLRYLWPSLVVVDITSFKTSISLSEGNINRNLIWNFTYHKQFMSYCCCVFFTYFLNFISLGIVASLMDRNSKYPGEFPSTYVVANHGCRHVCVLVFTNIESTVFCNNVEKCIICWSYCATFQWKYLISVETAMLTDGIYQLSVTLMHNFTNCLVSVS